MCVGGACLPWLTVGFGPTRYSSIENEPVCFWVSYAVTIPKTLAEKLVWLLPSSPTLDSVGRNRVWAAGWAPARQFPRGTPPSALPRGGIGHLTSRFSAAYFVVQTSEPQDGCLSRSCHDRHIDISSTRPPAPIWP